MFVVACARDALLIASATIALAALGCSGGAGAIPRPAVSESEASGSRAGLTSVLTGAGPTERESATLRVAAASDLRTVMTKIQPDLERQCRTRITYVFGSSGQLTTQIAAGAGFGLLLSADAQYPAQLSSAGLTAPNGVASYGVGRIALATRAGIEPLADVRALARDDVQRISIANPDHAPYGRAAVQALRSAGVYEQVRATFVLGENVRQATDYVEQGNADAGIVAYALVINGSRAKWTLIDAALHGPIEQTGAVVARTGAELTGRCVLQYLLDPTGQSALREFGFEAVPR